VAAGGVARVEFTVDGVLVATERSAPYCLGGDPGALPCNPWDTTRLTDGEHLFRATAYGSSGTLGQASLRLRVQNGAATPTITLVGLTESQKTGGWLRLEARLSSTTGVSRVDFEVGGHLIRSDTAAPYCLGGDAGSLPCSRWDTRAVTDGQQVIRATAYGPAGPLASTSVSVFVWNGPSSYPAPTPGTPLRRLCFTPKTDCLADLVRLINRETVGVDMTIYRMDDRNLTAALVNRHKAGVPVRVLTDRHFYTRGGDHKREVDYLVSNGVPVRINRHRGVVHQKSTVLRGQGLVQHGSMNYAWHSIYQTVNGVRTLVQWKDEVTFTTNDPNVFARFGERFDRGWANTGDFQETWMVFNIGMPLQTHAEADAKPPLTRYEDPVPSPRPVPDSPDLSICFGGDQDCNADAVAPVIKAETGRLDVFLFRVNEQADVIDPIVAKIRAGVPVRILVDKDEYETNASTRNAVAQFRAANTAGNLRMKVRSHAGQMHIKGVIGTGVATWGSGNFTWPSSTRVRGLQSNYYQEDDFMVCRDPALVATYRQHFDSLWASDGFVDLP
jgi:phosphatidylserine/phosphatidylglycerophosphate/cardiolipin synthase-like enzyme